MPAKRSFVFAGVAALALWLGGDVARADAIGVFDPVASEVCGGSYHEPNCSPYALLSGLCALCSIVVVGGVLAVRGRRAER